MVEIRTRGATTQKQGVSDDTAPLPCSDDAFLGGKLQILQPQTGYRAGIDPVFLAAAVSAGPGMHVLDAGAGVGVAALSLARRVEDVRVTGVELQADLVEFARNNALRNGLDTRATFEQGDIVDPPRELAFNTFDQVMVNPPFYDQHSRVQAAEAPKNLSHMGDGASLEAWLSYCLKMLKPKGELTLIHRADRLSDILRCLEGRTGGIRVLPLWPRLDKPAKRVLVKAVKGSRTPLKLLPGLTLHETERRFSARADDVLRQGAPLPF